LDAEVDDGDDLHAVEDAAIVSTEQLIGGACCWIGYWIEIYNSSG
jgi:hypothetical protein